MGHCLSAVVISRKDGVSPGELGVLWHSYLSFIRSYLYSLLPDCDKMRAVLCRHPVCYTY
jgi:hypothetical protein